MSWEELYPVVKAQAQWAVLRYDNRRKDKIQELIAQSYEKYLRDSLKQKEITKQDYKCFVTQRAKQVDVRSVCKKGLGGTSIIDALSFYRQRPGADTSIVEFDDWMTYNVTRRNTFEDALVFTIDFNNWRETLGEPEKSILDMLLEGHTIEKIALLLNLSFPSINQIIRSIRTALLRYFRE